MTSSKSPARLDESESDGNPYVNGLLACHSLASINTDGDYIVGSIDYTGDTRGAGVDMDPLCPAKAVAKNYWQRHPGQSRRCRVKSAFLFILAPAAKQFLAAQRAADHSALMLVMMAFMHTSMVKSHWCRNTKMTF